MHKKMPLLDVLLHTLTQYSTHNISAQLLFCFTVGSVAFTKIRYLQERFTHCSFLLLFVVCYLMFVVRRRILKDLLVVEIDKIKIILSLSE